MAKIVYTKASKVYHCECCQESILPGEALVILPGALFYKLGHEPKNEKPETRLDDTRFFSRTY